MKITSLGCVWIMFNWDESQDSGTTIEYLPRVICTTQLRSKFNRLDYSYTLILFVS